MGIRGGDQLGRESNVGFAGLGQLRVLKVRLVNLLGIFVSIISDARNRGTSTNSRN